MTNNPNRKLYLVTIKVYVEAQDFAEARYLAFSKAQPKDASVVVADSVDQAWVNSAPYADNVQYSGRTCGQILKERKEKG